MKNLITLIIIVICTSCKTSFVTQYRITTTDRSYYCNNPKFVNDTVYGAELQRNGKIKWVFSIPYDSVISVDYNGKKYSWR